MTISPDIVSPNVISSIVDGITSYGDKLPKPTGKIDSDTYQERARNVAFVTLAGRLIKDNSANDVTSYDFLVKNEELTDIYHHTDLAKQNIGLIADGVSRVYREVIFGTRFTPAIDGIDFSPRAIFMENHSWRYPRTSLLVASPYAPIPEQPELCEAFRENYLDTKTEQSVDLTIRAILISVLSYNIANGNVKYITGETGFYARDDGYEVDYRKLWVAGLQKAEEVFKTKLTYIGKELLASRLPDTLIDVAASRRFHSTPKKSNTERYRIH